MTMRPRIPNFTAAMAAGLSVSDVMGRWSFDTAQPLLSDSGSGATLTLRSAASITDAVAVGNKGLVFSPAAGTTSASDVGATLAGVVLPPEFTVWLRVRFDGSGSWGRVFDFGDGAGINNVLLGRNGTTAQIVAFVSPCGRNIFSSAILVAGAWISLALTCSSPNRRFALYANGALQASGVMTGDLPIKTRSNMFIGRSNWSGDAAFIGAMDDLVLYRRELSATDVAALG